MGRLNRHRPLLVVVGLLVASALLGCAHLLTHQWYRLVNYDGFYFHFIAHQIASGTAIPILGSGLAYPVAILAKLVGLDAASLMISPLLGILTGLVLYWGVSKLYSTKVAVLSVVCFVFCQITRLFYMSGNLDRDGLHLLVMTAGILGLGLFFKFRRTMYLALTFVSVAVLVYEWGVFGLVQYTPVLCFIVLLMGRYAWRDGRFWFATGLLASGMYVLGQLVMHVSMFHGTSIAEMGPLSFAVVIQFATISVPLVFGLKRSDGFAMCWLLGFVLLGFFASRLCVYAAAPACVIGGMGLEALWEKRSEWRLVFVLCCVMFLALSWSVPKNMAMPNDWHKALTWVNENTDENENITTWWSYGWWVYDIADRGSPATQATDDAVNAIAQVYYAPSAVQAQVIMQQNGWSYFVMSTREREFMDSIRDRVPGAEGEGAFYSSVMAGEVTAVYRNDSVVVLRVPWVG